MSDEVIITVLNEVLDELKQANKSLEQTVGAVAKLETRIQALEQKEIRSEPPDLGPLGERIAAECGQLRKETTAGLEKVAAMVQARWMVRGTIGAMIVLTTFVLINEWIGNMRPRELPATASGLSLPSGAPSQPQPPGPVHGTGEPGKTRRSKKIRKKIDTLEYKVIRDFSDSLVHN